MKMAFDGLDKLIPTYEGQEHLPIWLPKQAQPWLDGSKHALRQRKASKQKALASATGLIRKHPWHWPQRDIIFISDLHADADAFMASLIASGGVRKTGAKVSQYELTPSGKKALFILGGDFFDKGPSNLRLLKHIHQFIKSGARVRLLAGNHDIRVLFGMSQVPNVNDPLNGHFFIRMGAKAIPFLKEISEQYLTKKILGDMPSNKACAEKLFPGEQWWSHFPEAAKWMMPQPAIEREMSKITKKAERFEALCDEAGLSMKEVYAAALEWQKLFLRPEGEFYWFYQRMRLAHRRGSFLFVHAGLDDRTAALIHDFGVSHLNKLFKKQLTGNPFEFYYGPIANTIRTKYRAVDMPLTWHGTQQAHAAGVHVIVHGHRNLHRGQRIAVRKGLLHFECDVTLDKGSRKKEGLSGNGAGATLIRPTGQILGISSDYKKVKVFHHPSILTEKEVNSG